MKKFVVAVTVIAVLIGITSIAYEKVKVKSTDTKTVEKAKWNEGDVKGKEKTVVKDNKIKSKEKVSGKAGSVKSKEVTTADSVTGKTKIHIKKGALKNLKIDYVYYRQNKDYVLEYTINDCKNKNLMSELNLTPEQAKMIKKGRHTIVSTSPYTAGDVANEFRNIILKDIRSAR